MKIKNIVVDLIGNINPSYKDRAMVKFLKKHYNGKALTGCEIGVSYGYNAQNYLRNLNIKKMYLIDFYGGYIESNKKNLEHTGGLDRVLFLTDHFKNLELIVNTSERAAPSIPDNSLDFVYIDGCHDYLAVKKDIGLYYPKVKQGGVIGGHDFSYTFIGVIRAVLEFAEKHNYKIYGGSSDWWVIK